MASSPLYTSETTRSGAPCQDRVSDFLTSSHEGLQGPETPLTVKSWSPPQPIDPSRPGAQVRLFDTSFSLTSYILAVCPPDCHSDLCPSPCPLGHPRPRLSFFLPTPDSCLSPLPASCSLRPEARFL